MTSNSSSAAALRALAPLSPATTTTALVAGMGIHPKKLELTWHKPTRQWSKRFKGKEYYLGTGGGKSDLESCERAIAKWRSISETLQQAAKAEQQSALQQAYRAWGEQLASRPGIDISQYVSRKAVVLNDDDYQRVLLRRWGSRLCLVFRRTH